MKEFKKGDLVTSTNKYSDVFKKETIYLGITETNSGTKYHVVGIEKDSSITTAFITDDEIQLLATVKHTPIPVFKKGDVLYCNDHEVVVVKNRDSDLCYLCFDTITEDVSYFFEGALSREMYKPEPIENEAVEEDPNAELNSNYMKDSMPTIEKKDH